MTPDQMQREWDATLASRPREMPDDFAPQIDDLGDLIVCNFPVKLGFQKTGDATIDAKYTKLLISSVWQHLEAQRLGWEPMDVAGHA